MGEQQLAWGRPTVRAGAGAAAAAPHMPAGAGALPTWRPSSTTSGLVQNLVQCMVTWPHSSSRIMPAP